MRIFCKPELTEDLAYITAFIMGDGNLGSSYQIRAVEENEKFIEMFSDIFYKIFSKRMKIYFDKYNNSFVAYLHSKILWNYLINFGIPKGTKSRIIKIPKRVLESGNKVKGAFISGIFDAEGSVIKMKDSHHKNGYPRLQFKVYSKRLTIDISSILKDMGFNPKLYHYGDFSMIQLNGKMQCRMFNDIIGFKHPVKNKKLHMLL